MPRDDMQTLRSTIIYTKTDEAPQLAAASLLPILRRFAGVAGIEIVEKDISLAGRILAAFPEALSAEQRQSDDLAELADLVTAPEANVIKLPNISASLAQLLDAIAELQGKGYAIPDYPDAPATGAEHISRARYDAVKGSAVNPVLREGNSDRRAPAAVKAHARAHPHAMGAWSATSDTNVMTMMGGDFRANEVSLTLTEAEAQGPLQIVHMAGDGTRTVLADGLSYPPGTIIDGSYMSKAALCAFLDETIDQTAALGTLYSLHIKATMMKVADPIIFGHALRRYLAPVFTAYGAVLDQAGADPNAGLGVMLEALAGDPNGAPVLARIAEVLAARPPLYMVDSDKGISNFHVPSDVIIDASLPAILKAGGKAWGPDGQARDVTCVIPDSSYAGVYAAAMAHFKDHGALDPTTAGTVQNVGLMAKKAEEYGSHPTTFEITRDGTVCVLTAQGSELLSHGVQAGDIWRMASTRPEAIGNWVELALARRAATGFETVFWLDATRPHDAEILAAIAPILAAQEAKGGVRVLAPTQAATHAFETIRAGRDCIAVTGNVLRDYLTDLFPILEVGTSAKMLSVVGLMQGGGLFETGAGGSAPKHVQQFMSENHLRWDSLGEFCAIAEALRFEGAQRDNAAARLLGETADQAISRLLEEDRSPGRRLGEADLRDSHFHFARFWAEALATQEDQPHLARAFAPLARALSGQEETITAELRAHRGQATDLGGYYLTVPEKVAAAMRPSPTLNRLLDPLQAVG
ncbi:NADP-dependent isocitrate dehydrogenase [Dinoroseobacter sp. S76]|uniref:NADP-dependent isocitrate dehydrogenase n=1 Tax=Dinoroseobacter sp. S76 TaxID=3415124 RepID=UPI003C7BC39F